MTFRSLGLTALIALIAAPAFLSAQETTASEDERIEQLVRSEASEWYTPKDSFRVGFRVLSSGVNVRFGNLGSVAASASIAPATVGDRVNRIYDNGTVSVDDPRELNDIGSPANPQGGRYTSATGVDSVSYATGFTRNWSYSTQEQATENPGYIAMSTYSASSDGASFAKKQGPSVGVELEFSHAFRKLGKRTELGFSAGLAINGINNKTAGDVHSTLHKLTDYYLIAKDANGNQYAAPVTPGANPYPYSGPSYSSDGKTETTVPIASTATGDPKATATAGAALVHGNWQVRGTYMMVRIGPSLRTQVTNNLGVSATVGIAGAYVGTHYSAFESLEIPLLNKTVADLTTDSDETKFLAGYYGDFNIEWNANEVVALYGGVSAQKFGDYNQSLGDRTARIDLGATVGLRGGLNIKF